jgi:alkanesulfonate monooxygenase SsuD/methylene tetrahydromethanopterin reductase-like flavin-dependent oxidoreductase (luciferase family)
MDGLINAATLTALSPRLKVCVGVYLLALRHPVPVARQLATLAESAPGQLILGIGVGGEDRNEIAMCGVDPASRGRRTDEALAVVQGLLQGEPMDHEGEFFRFERGWIRPKPATPIPFVIGGRADAALERAARYGDGWLGVWSSARRFADVVAQIDARASELGRPRPGLHGMQVWTGVDDDRDRARARLAKRMESFYRVPFERFEKYSPYGTPAEIADFLEPYAEAGCELFNVMPVAASEEAGIDAVAEIRRRLLS